MAKKHGGHHGGSWKVAYADFVTAMMALFLCLWLTSQDQKIKEAIERAFRNPFMSLTKGSTGLIENKSQSTSRGGSGKFDNATVNQSEVAMLRRLQAELAKSLQKKDSPEQEESVRINLTPEGLRINVFDRSRKPAFEPDSEQLTDYGAWILTTLAWEIARYPGFSVELEGHTERGPAVTTVAHRRRAGYGDWELSADRANSGRRKLVEHGVTIAQINKVAGFADRYPLEGSEPDDPINRRLTLLLRVNPDATSK